MVTWFGKDNASERLKLSHGSLFSGIGGFDLAAEWMGWENVFHCEWAEFPRKVLEYHFPNAISYNDIKQTDFTIHRGQIDILTGGFPCQPYSNAGKRLGKADDRHLWPEMLRAIRESQPKWVVGENVRGLINWNGGMVFDEVQADLEAEGYEVLPFLLPACAVNAPHRRDRIWFVAYSRHNSKGKTRISSNDEGLESSTLYTERQTGIKKTVFDSGLRNLQGIDTNADSNGQHGSDSEHEEHTGEGRKYALNDAQPLIMHPDSASKQGQHVSKEGEREFDGPDSGNGFNYWQNFPTQPPICGGNDGLPRQLDGVTFSKWRQESIKAFGNAIVPQVALQIFKAIEQYLQIR